MPRRAAISSGNVLVRAMMRKAGPLPVWAWTGFLAGAVYWWRNRQAQKAAAATPAQETVPTLKLIPYTLPPGAGGGGGGTSTPPPVTEPPPVTGPPPTPQPVGTWYYRCNESDTPGPVLGPHECAWVYVTTPDSNGTCPAGSTYNQYHGECVARTDPAGTQPPAGAGGRQPQQGTSAMANGRSAAAAAHAAGIADRPGKDKPGPPSRWHPKPHPPGTQPPTTVPRLRHVPTRSAGARAGTTPIVRDEPRQQVVSTAAARRASAQAVASSLLAGGRSRQPPTASGSGVPAPASREAGARVQGALERADARTQYLTQNARQQGRRA